MDYDVDSHHTDKYLWGVEYDDGFTEDFDEVLRQPVVLFISY